jgi:hypothetical protein
MVEKHVLYYRQLYEQLSKKATSDEMAFDLGQYVNVGSDGLSPV